MTGKGYKLAFALIEDSDRRRSLIRVFDGRSMDSQRCNFFRRKNQDSDQTARMRRRILIFAERTCQLVHVP